MKQRLSHLFRNDLFLILGLAAIVRCLYFRGFGEADDVAYTYLVREFLSGKSIFSHVTLFAGRPGVFLPITLSVKLFGWTEWAAVLPTFLLSLAEIAACYWIALKNAGRRNAIVAALALTFFPFHWSYATTICADMMGSAAFWVGIALAASAWAPHPQKGRPLLNYLAGLVVGLSFSMKVNTLFMFIPLGLTGLALLYRSRSVPKEFHHVWRQIVLFCLGILTSLALLFAFYGIFSQSPWSWIEVELSFNRAATTTVNSQLKYQLLQFYPRLIGMGAELWNGEYVRAPFGLLFLTALAASPFALYRGPRWAKAAVLWFIVLLAIYEFWPVSFHPYAPIHRLPRHLAPLSVPAALLIGWALVRLWDFSRAGRGSVALFFAVYLWTSFAAVRHLDSAHRRCMQDVRATYQFVETFWPGPVAAGQDLINYFQFRQPDFFKHRETRVFKTSREDIPSGFLVIQGGCQRPTSPPIWSDLGRPLGSSRWKEIVRRPSACEGDGYSPIRFSIVEPLPGPLLEGNDPFSTLAQQQCGGSPWHLRDQVLAAESNSYSAHNVKIGGGSYFTANQLLARSGEKWVEVGFFVREFLEYQAFNLQPGQPVCIAWLLRPEYPHFNIASLEGQSPSPGLGPEKWASFGYWNLKTQHVPGSQVKGRSLTIREEPLTPTANWESYLIQIYQTDAQ